MLKLLFVTFTPCDYVHMHFSLRQTRQYSAQTGDEVRDSGKIHNNKKWDILNVRLVMTNKFFFAIFRNFTMIRINVSIVVSSFTNWHKACKFWSNWHQSGTIYGWSVDIIRITRKCNIPFSEVKSHCHRLLKSTYLVGNTIWKLGRCFMALRAKKRLRAKNATTTNVSKQERFPSLWNVSRKNIAETVYF